MAENGPSIPSYNDIFCPPDTKLREPNKLYGKKLLEACFKEHHSLLLDNYRIVRGWFKDYHFVSDLRHNLPEQQKVHALIESKLGSLKPLDFGKAVYQWQEVDIYQYVVSYIQSQRKYGKTKATKIVHAITNINSGEKSNEELPVLIEAPTIALVRSEDEREALCEQEKHLEVIESEFKRSGDENPSIALRDELFTLWKESEKMDVPMFEEESESEDFHLDVLNGSQFPCFSALLEHGNLKRVRAMPQIQEQSMNDMPLKVSFESTNVTSKSIEESCGHIRKSDRERKISEKLKDSLVSKKCKARMSFKKKKIKEINNIQDSGVGDTVQANLDVPSLSIEEKETVLLKYFDVHTIEDMYLVLKATYYKIKREECTFREDRKLLTLEEMRDSLVGWLVSTERITLNRQLGHDLTFEEVEIVSHY